MRVIGFELGFGLQLGVRVELTHLPLGERLLHVLDEQAEVKVHQLHHLVRVKVEWRVVSGEG